MMFCILSLAILDKLFLSPSLPSPTYLSMLLTNTYILNENMVGDSFHLDLPYFSIFFFFWIYGSDVAYAKNFFLREYSIFFLILLRCVYSVSPFFHPLTSLHFIISTSLYLHTQIHKLFYVDFSFVILIIIWCISQLFFLYSGSPFSLFSKEFNIEQEA